ncbi:MAG: pentapeptide repeat-containing protein [Pseudomonadota bacterium]
MTDGQWVLDNDIASDAFHSSENSLVQLWLKSARIDFSTMPDDWSMFELRVGNLDFPGDVKFAGAQFDHSLVLAGCVFYMKALFNSTTFKSDVSFASSTFMHYVTFYGATFEKTAIFRQTSFQAPNIFVFADFRRGITLQGARFYTVPNFADAKSFIPPRMDDVRIANQMVSKLPGNSFDPRPLLFRNRFVRIAPDANTYVHFQKLRVFAREANDHRIQSEFYAREVEARRFWVDDPFRVSGSRMAKLSADNQDRYKAARKRRRHQNDATWLEKERLDLSRQQSEALRTNGSFWRFWMGIAYGFFSNFGRSLARPLALLCATFLFFSMSYFDLASQQTEAKCTKEESRVAALSYSTLNSFIGIGTVDVSLQQRAVECLIPDSASQGEASLSLSVMSHFQKTISFVCLFLFGLGIRNSLKLT